jgi:uncharacterized Zn finger protein
MSEPTATAERSSDLVHSRALLLIEAGGVKILEADHRSGFVVAHVTGSRGDVVYSVSKRGQRWQCSCVAKSYGNRCSHIAAVQAVT